MLLWGSLSLVTWIASKQISQNFSWWPQAWIDNKEITLDNAGHQINRSPQTEEIIETLNKRYPPSSGQLDKALVMLDSIIATWLVDKELADTMQSVLLSWDQEKIAWTMDEVMQEIQSNWEHHEWNQALVMILSVLATAWFWMMIVWAAKWKTISFVKHHAVFAALTLIMWTQMPHEIMHWLIESLVAFLAIFGIVRGARWITNIVNMEDLDSEQTKAVLWLLWPIASIITTPAAAWIFAPLRKNLKEDDQYVAMQTVGNMDWAVGIGDFPFIYNFMKNWIAHWAVWQLGVMWPVMLFHKIYQWLLRKISPQKLRSARPQIWNILKWFRFDKSRLWASTSIAGEELEQAQQFLAFLKNKLQLIEALSNEEKNIMFEAISNEEHDLWVDIPWIEHIKNGDDIQNLQTFTDELENMLSSPDAQKDIAVIVEETRRAMIDGHISREELEQFIHISHDSHAITDLSGKIGFSQIISKREHEVDNVFNKLMCSIHANHNEVEIARVFTAQALAISLLIPSFSVLLESVPQLLEGADAWFSSVADNYAATAVTRTADNAKAIAFAIIWWALSIYGNMANLNFMGNDGNFKKSLIMAKYVLPTLLFAYWWFNSEKIASMVSWNHLFDKSEIKKTSKRKENQIVYGETPEQYEKIYWVTN